MPLSQELSGSQIRQSLDEAIRRRTPVAMSCRVGQQWHNLRTRALQRTGGSLWLEFPVMEPADTVDLVAGLEVGLSFKLKHHKHIFNVPVEAAGELEPRVGQKVQALRVTMPARMQRVQRRAYLRAEVPRNRSVLATFWQGEPGADHPAESDTPPTWEGWVTNISAGGFQVRLSHGAPELDLGEVVSVRIDLGQEYEPVTAMAQFRQHHMDDRAVRYHGFQFVGLNETPQGRKMLRRIGKTVCEFQRLQGRRRAHNVA